MYSTDYAGLPASTARVTRKSWMRTLRISATVMRWLSTSIASPTFGM
jgi:hypothetical protein